MTLLSMTSTALLFSYFTSVYRAPELCAALSLDVVILQATALSSWASKSLVLFEDVVSHILPVLSYFMPSLLRSYKQTARELFNLSMYL